MEVPLLPGLSCLIGKSLFFECIQIKVGPTYNDVTNYIARRFVRIKILYWLLRLLDI